LRRIVWSKVLLFAVCLAPLAMLAWDVWRALAGDLEALGADPGEAIVHHLGEWGIRLLLATLAVSSIARLTGRPSLIRYRRMVGLFAFVYVALHFSAYFGILAGAELAALLGDLSERPYIIAGGGALLILIPLALTSTRAAQRRLRHNWRRLHRLVYVAAVLAVLHIAWLAKVSYVDAYIYGSLALLLLGERVFQWVKTSQKAQQNSRQNV